MEVLLMVNRLHPHRALWVLQRGGEAQPGCCVSITCLMDKLVFVQESCNCTTMDPFEIFKHCRSWTARASSFKSHTVKGHCGWKRSVTVVLSPCWQSGFCLRDTSDAQKHVPRVQQTSNKTVNYKHMTNKHTLQWEVRCHCSNGLQTGFIFITQQKLHPSHLQFTSNKKKHILKHFYFLSFYWIYYIFL